MLFWFLLLGSLTLAIFDARRRYKDFFVGKSFEPSETALAMRRKAVRGVVIGHSIGYLAISAFIIGFITMAVRANTPEATVVEKNQYALSALNSVDLRVIGDGVKPYDTIVFRIDSDIDSTKSNNNKASIITDLGELAKPHVEVITSEYRYPLVAPFSLGTKTTYDLHVAPHQVGGTHILTVR